MIIKEYEGLKKSKKHEDALEIVISGLEAAKPENFLPKWVKRDRIILKNKSFELENYRNIYTVAFGKAADSMTRVVNSIIDVKSGIVVIPKGSKSIIKGKKFQIFNSSHPKPNKESVRAAKIIIKFLEKRKNDELVIFLVSGGGSSLLALPDSITLSDKIHVTDTLLKSGATIQEFNCIRKHLSKIKGGRLVENLPCDGLGLVMSDVEGDDLSSIASGTTYMDSTTFQDAFAIIKKYKLEKKMPLDVLKRIDEGLESKILETPKNEKIPNQIVASNSDCLEAMKKKAKQLGYKTDSLQVFGNIKDAVKKIIKKIPQKEKNCLIFGGETTVEVLGKGSGGRNQEMVLRIIKNMQKSKKVVICSVGTDGIDGNTVFAGSISENIRVDSDKIKEYLKNSNSNSFFQKYGGLIQTGYTHTNLMDIGLVLR